MEKLKVGDVVKLKSGGPKMTVHSVDDDSVSCVWFLVSGVDIKEYSGPFSEAFKNDQLELS